LGPEKLLLDCFYTHEKERKDMVYLRQPFPGQDLKDYTWGQVADQSRRMASYLKSLELPPGSSICTISKNCAHWLMADFAIFLAGHVSVPLYPNIKAETVTYIMEHCGAKVLFHGKLDDWAPMKPGVPEGTTCITFPMTPDPDFTTWDDITSKYEPMEESPQRDGEEIATIIYTSGTTGRPKGVVHNFNAMAFSAENLGKLAGAGPNHKYFSYLPLSHVAERMITEMIPLRYGGTVTYVESLDTFPQNLQDCQPNVFFAVPRIWTKFQLGVLQKMPQKKLDLLLKIPILNNIIRKKIQTALGLNKVIMAGTGAAAISKDLLQWWKNLGVNILEYYAMSENFAYSHGNKEGSIKFGTVGVACPGVEHRISEEGEIQVRSICNMQGYYKQEDLSKEAFEEGGWLKTGDQGEIDGEGFLKITGRVKDLFKTSKGKYVAPSPIELIYSNNSNIEQVCVVGSSLPQPIVLVVPSEQGRKLDNGALESEFSSLRESINNQIDHHERIQTLVVLNEDWTVENELLTPTMKIKRNAIEKKFGDNFESWYNSDKRVLKV